ncbi:MAG TPA: gliding motility-associated C-terminal domain-containing protein, partial [Bacteroidia bacterium]|nr:gliding motility-associated C-terminal domain-containing protein [Bacteroidia bacterium]
DTLTVGPASTTTYSITGTDINGCTNNAMVTVNVGAVVVTASAAPPAVCSGSSTTITAGGAATYAWNTGATTAVINVSPTVATTYTVVGTSGSCNGTATVIVNVNPTPTITASSISATVCPGDTTSAYATISGGTPAYSYAWSSGQTTATASGLSGGTYTVTVTDANTCASNSATVTINVNNIVVTASAANSNLCAGSSTVLTASGATNYTWSLPAGLTTTTFDTTTANPGSTVTYTVMGTTTGKCKDSATVVITVNTPPVITASASSDSICSGGAGTILNANGGNTYVWSDGSTGTPVNETPAVNTTYTVTGTDVNGCIGTATVSINVSPTPTVSISVIPSNDTVCPGQSVTITASSSAGSYLWSDGSTTSSVTFTPATSPATYSVVATSGACSSNASQSVYLYSPVALNMLALDSICTGGSAAIGALATGGKTAYNYVWTPASVGSGPGPFVVSPAASTTYSCTVTDACGSIATSSTQVVITSAAVASFTATPNPVPGGQFVSFVNNSINATSWYWTFGDGQASTVSFPYHQYDTAGTYLVTLAVKSANGCRDTVRDTIHVIEMIYVPNVFTPNGDGQNDVFHITATSVKTYSIEIFNRWGQRVFSTDSPNIDWSGRSESGVMESDGIYYYIILATDYAGKNFKYDGYVQLIGGGGTQ